MIHFVYAVPPPQVGASVTMLKTYSWLSKAGIQLPHWYRHGWMPGLPNPLQAPWTITKNLFTYLRRYTRVKLYDWDEYGQIQCGPRDIILGHPHSDPQTIIQQTVLASPRCRLKALLFPMHHAMPTISQFTLPLIKKADKVLGIMGPYWRDRLDQSHFAPWKHKITSLDMAIDVREYPFVKKQFNPPGRRGYLYIGGNRPEKGCDVLSATMKQLNGFRRGWIGGGEEILNVPRLAPYASLTPQFVSSLANEYDFFVNTSVSDANPTTILEAMAWGFPVACTPQSGYYNMSTVTTLNTTDIEDNVKKLLDLQYAPEERLQQMSREARRLVETHYTWEHFCSSVWRELEPYALG